MVRGDYGGWRSAARRPMPLLWAAEVAHAVLQSRRARGAACKKRSMYVSFPKAGRAVGT